ncbi:SigE family RNA polymerase sigma factor [Saccharothrix coeruleofusca]|uniref:RNA polymerase sigma24 factor n=1 Tax=Saccharothrix coeruleofusca TaxID=33919 RepID=A0A918AQG5_9PSEU|nr:SigE family RNA polymerase sigma factor [Saccharothrix coeruleofusca]MBP2339016.1 RNA polymerase sigma-70 factor (sigma-E family) [Saccharothrix coeruleofusca]GGP69507.1 RNA polymerase sigma24 factor [Saccharothrix coeruleofusca]
MTSSFEDFAAEHVTPLLRYATVLTCDPHLAQDVVQECLLRAQQRWGRIGVLDAPGAYVKRMVTNEFLSWRRRLRPAGSIEGLDPAGEDPTARYDERDALLRLIARLPRKQRAAIVLRYYEGCDDAEIAAYLGCSQGTVRSHISRALATLRAQDRVKEAL